MTLKEILLARIEKASKIDNFDKKSERIGTVCVIAIDAQESGLLSGSEFAEIYVASMEAMK